MHRYQVFIRCRELPSAHAEYTYDENAGSFNVAAAAAIRKFRREPYARRRRLTTLELRITCLGFAPARPRREEHVLPLYDREK